MQSIPLPIRLHISAGSVTCPETHSSALLSQESCNFWVHQAYLAASKPSIINNDILVIWFLVLYICFSGHQCLMKLKRQCRLYKLNSFCLTKYKCSKNLLLVIWIIVRYFKFRIDHHRVFYIKKGGPGAAVKLLHCNHEVMGSSPGNGLLQKCRERLCT
jgi:hypothetical protein